MNNEPVAYAMFRNGEYYDAIHPDEQAKTVGEYDIPLYTHPVKEQEIKEAKYGITTKWDGITTYHETTEPIAKVKELTDEEIISEWIGNNRNYYNFARAILRKASEK